VVAGGGEGGVVDDTGGAGAGAGAFGVVVDAVVGVGEGEGGGDAVGWGGLVGGCGGRQAWVAGREGLLNVLVVRWVRRRRVRERVGRWRDEREERAMGRGGRVGGGWGVMEFLDGLDFLGLVCRTPDLRRENSVRSSLLWM